MNTLNLLRNCSDVVADTGDIDEIARYKPTDATTNPTLILNASKLDKYQGLIVEAVDLAKQRNKPEGMLTDACDIVSVKVGCEILKHINGRISTEVDARLSFDTTATVAKAKKLIALYNEFGVSKERVLIKIAATWHGIKAAEILEQEGIQCNLTLIFSMAQAKACAEANVYLISPFVGRISDWYKAKGEVAESADQDFGVLSVKGIYEYYKACGYQTIVMAASFRNKETILALSGCDKLTISPALLAELEGEEMEIERKLIPHPPKTEKSTYSESEFYFDLNNNAMAIEKLSEGIRNFAIDQNKLEHLINEYLGD